MITDASDMRTAPQYGLTEIYGGNLLVSRNALYLPFMRGKVQSLMADTTDKAKRMMEAEQG